jgi:hypothetical protein
MNAATIRKPWQPPGWETQQSSGHFIMKPKVLALAVVVLWLATSTIYSFGQQGNSLNPLNDSAVGANDSVGTVVSTSRETLVIRTSENQFRLFVFDRYTVRPRTLTPGAQVRVASTPTDDADVRLATNITMLAEAPSGQPAVAPEQAAPPREVRDLERDIQKQVKRWRIGVRAGAALDPELVLFGVHSQIGPFFHRDISFRPNAEFAFGEVTDVIAINLEAVYRLPISSRQGRWSAYFGAGPALNFIHQDFERSQVEGRDISFSNLDYDTGLNVLTGLQFRRGTFFELKTSLWSKPAPTMRLIFGYTF